MHFLLTTPYFPTPGDPTTGGFIHRQARALAARGHRVDVIHIQPRPLPLQGRAPRWRARVGAPAHTRYDGLEVFQARYPSATQRARLRRFQAGAVGRAIGRVLRSHPALAAADVVYAQWLVPYGYGTLLAARRRGLPCMAIARGADLNLWGRTPALRRQLLAVVEQADAVLGNGRYVSHALATLAARPLRRPVEVVYNPCDLTAFFRVDRDDGARRRAARRAVGLPPNAPAILFVGQLDVRKGADTVLAALARLAPAWRLVVAGTGALEPTFRAQAAAAGAGRVHLLGAVAHDGVPELMTACDVLVLPSRREGLPNAVVEGLAAAMPVVTTPVGGTPEIVVDGSTGWLVPPDRPDALAAAVAGAHASPVEARRRAAAGRAHVAQLFDLEHNLARLETIAARIARRRPAAAVGT